MAPLTGPGGQNDGILDLGATSALWAIPRALQSEPETLAKIFALLNYISEGDGSLLVQFGLKDVHFTMEGTSAIATEMMSKPVAEGGAGYTFIYQLTPARAGVPLYQICHADRLHRLCDFAAAAPSLQRLFDVSRRL
ncbi:hypothetical protein HC891_28065 [Candidatus Gracilibacteria bacterium]|nr:hypothetical protein [Candidatus Gracilibacteria bacterium]